MCKLYHLSSDPYRNKLVNHLNVAKGEFDQSKKKNYYNFKGFSSARFKLFLNIILYVHYDQMKN